MPFISSLSDAYRTPYVFDPEEYPPEPVSPGYYIPQGMDTPILPYIPQSQSALVKHYLDHVLMRQYLLADSSISEFIIRTIQKSAAVRDAVCLLSALHRASLVNSGAVESASALTPASSESDYVQIYRRIHHTLVPAAGRADYSEDEALTGLLVVSAFLFRGGRGQWLQFLTVAAEWVGGLLAGYTDPDGAAALLLRCTDSQRFIIKTTFWFDILASATRREPPLFLPWYRRLWGAPRARIDVLDGAAGPHASADEQKLSMMTVMGCENATALAIAETSDLAHWKATHAAAGTLSVPDLVDRGRTIEGTLLPAPSPPSPQPPYGVFDGYDGFGGDDDIGRRRRYTADIFRGAAKIYLHSVLSGEHPLNPEIRDGVAAVVATLRKLPPVQPGGSPTHANAHLHGGGAAGSGAYASSASSSSTYGASPTYGSAGSSFGSASSSSTYGPSSSSSTYGPSSSSSAYGPSAAAGFPFSAPPAGSKPASLASSVLRSAVFGITLAGCLTDDYASRVYILARLRGEEREEGVGNCAEARKVMEYVWDARARGVEGGWREAMQKVGLGAGELLLV
ncbi:hypothetical protein FA95DRAFT_1553622 [Auriscalpium vulgare]|uniref:Uncharacterized protein n=1 Tax=Auriscalpium vulgare TaxID=40419 RepID=A0ACB8S732_9AGAM|nr:hypothetical protein FA95DRAFT_1553622 [Auriscalpium vulgare]